MNIQWIPQQQNSVSLVIFKPKVLSNLDKMEIKVSQGPILPRLRFERSNVGATSEHAHPRSYFSGHGEFSTSI